VKNKKVYLAIDLGAESGRAITGWIEEKRLKIEEIHRFPTYKVQIGKHFFWDAPAIFTEIKKTLSTIGKQEISGIGVTTWGVDYAFIDKHGILMSLPFHYRDSRTESAMPEVFKKVEKQRIFRETGIQFMPINTLYQIYATNKHSPWMLKSADKMLFMPDLFNYWLCGATVNEFTIASTSQMLNLEKKKFKPRGDWTYGILRKLSIPTRFLVDVIPPGKKLGTLSKDIQEETKTGKIPVFSVCCHDTASAVFAVPAKGKNWAYLSSGTWSLLGKEIDAPIINDDVLSFNFTNEGGYGGKIRFLKNIMGLWIWQECRRQWEEEQNKQFSYIELGELASKEKPFYSLIDVNHPDFFFPGNMIEKIRKFCKSTNQKIPETPGQISRVILESLALEYKLYVGRLESIAGQIDVLHIVGGGSQNKVLSGFAASATKKDILCGPVEATSIGNIGVQMIADKTIKNHDEFRQVVRNSFPLIEYHPENPEDWNQPYEKYLKLKKMSESFI